MSKTLKKDHSPLKFDTSFANLHCFIRTKSKQKNAENQYPHRNSKSKKKSKNDHSKQPEFQDKAFLESVVCKILNDVDCKGINELIDNMVFPSSSSGENEHNKDHRKEQIEQEEISQIFSNFRPYSRQQTNKQTYGSSQVYHILTPSQSRNSLEKQDQITTIHSSFNSFSGSPREANSNPQIQMLKSLNPIIPLGYSYSYYQQQPCLYQRQVSQRKRRTVSGEEASEYRIIPEQIQADGRTTVMIRHIPNKYSEEMLLEEIGKKHRQKINFLYLPIDPYNTCNVGYGFANFIHTKFILEFHEEFNGRRWDCYNSQKICELAYARIQGTTNLMDRYNSDKEKKKSAMGLDSDAIKDINKIIDHQKVEEK